MDDSASPTVRRRRLAAELRALRENANRSGDVVAGALGWSPSKISRYERAKTGLRPREVERLLDYYRVRGDKRAALLALAEDASQKGWWEEFASSLPEDYQRGVGASFCPGFSDLPIEGDPTVIPIADDRMSVCQIADRVGAHRPIRRVCRRWQWRVACLHSPSPVVSGAQLGDHGVDALAPHCWLWRRRPVRDGLA